MTLRTLIAAGVAAAFAVPLTVHAQAGGPAGASAQGTGATGGVPSTQSMGEPQDFTSMDRDKDGQVSRAEWDQHYRSGASGSATGGATGSGSSATTDTTPASAPHGTTGGTARVSPRTGPGLPTATEPGTSGHGAPQ